MRVAYLSILAAALLLGAGCGQKDETLPGASDVPLKDRIAPTQASMPTAEPQIPEAAKNIPRPEVK